MDYFVTDIEEQLHSPFLAVIEKVAKGKNLINQQIEWKISDFSLLLFMYTVLMSNKPLSFGTHLCYFNDLKMETKVGALFLYITYSYLTRHPAFLDFIPERLCFTVIVPDGISII